ncbi:MAG: PEP-CTERM sorting domain-containing protein [bacterium]
MSIHTILRRTARVTAVAIALVLTASAASAQSLLMTNTIVGTTIDFSSLTADTFLPFASLTGVTLEPIGDIEFYAIGSYDLVDNGLWTSPGSSASGVGTSNAFASFMRFTFDTPVSAVGGFVNYCVSAGFTCNGFSATMRAFDVDFNVVGAYDIDFDAPIVTTAVNDGAFRGIDVGAASSIKYLDWGGSYVVMSDLTYGATTVTPEPASLALFATGLVSMAGVVRRRRRRQ